MGYYDMYDTNADQAEKLRALFLEAFSSLMKQHENVKHTQEKEREIATITEDGKYTYLRMTNSNAIVSDAFLDFCGVKYTRLDLDKGNFQYKIPSDDYRKVMDTLISLKEGKITGQDLLDAYRASGKHNLQMLDEILAQYEAVNTISSEEELEHDIPEEVIHETDDNAEWKMHEEEFSDSDLEENSEKLKTDSVKDEVNKKAEKENNSNNSFEEEYSPEIEHSSDIHETNDNAEWKMHEEEEFSDEQLNKQENFDLTEDKEKDVPGNSPNKSSYNSDDISNDISDSRDERAEDIYEEETPKPVTEEQEFSEEALNVDTEDEDYFEEEKTEEKKDNYSSEHKTEEYPSEEKSESYSSEYKEEYKKENYEEAENNNSSDYSSEFFKQEQEYNNSNYQEAYNGQSIYEEERQRQNELINQNRHSNENVEFKSAGNGNDVQAPAFESSYNNANDTQKYGTPDNDKTPPYGTPNNENTGSGNGAPVVGNSLFDNSQTLSFNKINYDSGYLSYRSTELYERTNDVLNAGVSTGMHQSDVGAGWKSTELVRNVIGSTILLDAASGMVDNARAKLSQNVITGNSGIDALNNFIAQTNGTALQGKLDFSSKTAAEASNVMVMEALKKKGLVTGNAKDGYDSRKLEFFMRAAATNEAAMDKLNKMLGLRVANANDKYGLKADDVKNLYSQIAQINNYGKATGQNRTKTSNIKNTRGARNKQLSTVLVKDGLRQSDVYKGYQSVIGQGKNIGRTFVAVKVTTGYIGRKIVNIKPIKAVRKAIGNTRAGKSFSTFKDKMRDFKEKHGRASKLIKRGERKTARLKTKLSKFRGRAADAKGIKKAYFNARAKRLLKRINPKEGFFNKVKSKIFNLLDGAKKLGYKFIKYLVVGLGAYMLLGYIVVLAFSIFGTITSFLDGLHDLGTRKEYEVKDIWWDTANSVAYDLRNAEAEWMHQLKTGASEATKANQNMATFFYGRDYKHIVNYLKENPSLGLKSGYDYDSKNKNGQKYYVIGKNPFPDILTNEEAETLGIQKKIRAIDGKVVVEYENASGQSHHTSNVKEIICMSNVFYDLDGNYDEYAEASEQEYKDTAENPPTGFKKNLNDIGGGLKYVALYVPNIIMNWNDRNATEKTLLNYCIQLFNISHQEIYDLQYSAGLVNGLIDKTQNGTGGIADGEANGTIFFCPEENGCATYSGFYYNDYGSICLKTGNALKSVAGRVIINEDQRCVPVYEGSDGKDVAKAIGLYPRCWIVKTYHETSKTESVSSYQEVSEAAIAGVGTDWTDMGTKTRTEHKGDYNSKNYSKEFKDIVNTYAVNFGNNYNDSKILGITRDMAVYSDNATVYTLTVDMGSVKETKTEKRYTTKTDSEGNTIYMLQTRSTTKTTPHLMVFTHSCVGENHSGSYCGGHLHLTVTGKVYGFTEEQIGDRTVEGSIGEVVSKVPDDYEPPTTNKTYVQDFSVTELEDIFDADSKIVRKVTSENWQGWTKDNMELAVLKYTMDWGSLYGFDFGQEMDGVTLSEEDLDYYMMQCAETLGESDDRADMNHSNTYRTIEKMLKLVGNYLYAETHAQCIPTDCRSTTSHGVGAICSFGVTEGYMTIFKQAMKQQPVTEVLTMDNILSGSGTVSKDYNERYAPQPGDIIYCAGNQSYGIVAGLTPASRYNEEEDPKGEYYWAIKDVTTGKVYKVLPDRTYYYITFRRSVAKGSGIKEYTSLGIEQVNAGDISNAYRIR